MSTEMSPPFIGEPVWLQPHDDFWTTDPERFDFDLDFDRWTSINMASFEKKELWHQTCLQLITAKKNEPDFLDVQNSFIYEDEAMTLDPSKTDQEGNANSFELLQVPLNFIPPKTPLLITSLGSSISKFLKSVEGQAQLPKEEHGLLRVSPTVLRHLASTYRIPSAFLASVSRPFDSCGTAFRRQSQHEWDYWCLLPFRLSIGENDPSTAGSNQMDPSYHIHFEGQHTTIYSSTIALYTKRNCNTGKTHVFVVNYGGGLEFILQPLARVRKFLKQRSSVDLDGIPCFVLLIYIACMLTWWNHALQFFNAELISQEINLQELIADEAEEFINTSKVLNAALHSMAAHLHRYKTELQRTDLVLSDLRRYRGEMTYKPDPKPRDREEDVKQEDEKEDDEEASPPIDRELQKIEQLASKLAAISSSVDEMERKVQNILALLFNQIQAINDITVSSDDTTASNAPSAVDNGENTSFDGNKQHWWQRVSQIASQGGIELRVRRGS